jgi:hypothetical protein
MTLRNVTLSITALIIMTFSIMTLGNLALNKKTLQHYSTHGNDTQQKDT